MRDTMYYWRGRFNLIETSPLTMLIYKFNTTPIKISTGSFSRYVNPKGHMDK